MDRIGVYTRWTAKNCPPGTARPWAEARGWLRIVQLHADGGELAWLEDFTAWMNPELPLSSGQVAPPSSRGRTK